MAVINKINFNIQGNYRTRVYIFGLNKILKQCRLDKRSKSLLAELVAVKENLKNGEVKLNENTRKKIKDIISKLEESLRDDVKLHEKLSSETKKLCQRIRAKKHYKSDKEEMTKIKVYASTKYRLVDLGDELFDGADELTWPELMEQFADALEKMIY